MKRLAGPLAILLLAVLVPGLAAAQIQSLLHCDFEDCPVDQPIATRGPSYGEPSWYNDFLTAIVRDGIMATRCLVLQDDDLNHSVSGSVRFDFLGDAEVQHDRLEIAMDLRFDAPEDFYIGVYDPADEYNSVTTSFLMLKFDGTGWIHVHGSGSDPVYGIAQYTGDTTYRLALSFDMERHRCRVEWNGTPVVTDRDFGVQGVGIGSLWFGTLFDQDTAGAMAVDNITVTQAPVATERTSWGAVKGLYR